MKPAARKRHCILIYCSKLACFAEPNLANATRALCGISTGILANRQLTLITANTVTGLYGCCCCCRCRRFGTGWLSGWTIVIGKMPIICVAKMLLTVACNVPNVSGLPPGITLILSAVEGTPFDSLYF